MWLLLVAVFGLLVPNGLFIQWLATEFSGIDDVFSNKLAVAFMLDAAMATGLIAYVFAIRPIGRVKWPWFVVFSIVGGLGFSIPFYVWLNRRMLD
jgi:hypothetical protein